MIDVLQARTAGAPGLCGLGRSCARRHEAIVLAVSESPGSVARSSGRSSNVHLAAWPKMMSSPFKRAMKCSATCPYSISPISYLMTLSVRHTHCFPGSPWMRACATKEAVSGSQEVPTSTVLKNSQPGLL